MAAWRNHLRADAQGLFDVKPSAGSEASVESKYTIIKDRAAFDLLHDAQEKNEFLTGLIYVEPTKKDFLSLLHLPEEPLAIIADDRARPGREALDQMMAELK